MTQPCCCETQLLIPDLPYSCCLPPLIAGGTWTSRWLPFNKQQEQDWCAIPTRIVSQPAGLVFHIRGTAGPCCLLRTSSAICHCNVECLADSNTSNACGSSVNSNYSSSPLNTIASVLQLLAGDGHSSGNCRRGDIPACTDDKQSPTAEAAALRCSSARKGTAYRCPPAPTRPKPPVTLMPVMELMPCAHMG